MGKLIKKLIKEAHKKGIFKTKNPTRFNKYVYGTEQKIKREKSKK